MAGEMTASDRTPCPTQAELLSWRDRLKSDFGQFATEVEEESDLYYQEFVLEAPGGALTVKTGSAPSDVDAAVDTLVPLTLDVTVPPALGRKKYKTQADRLAMSARGLDRCWRRKHDVVRDVVTDMAMRRVGIGRVLKDPERWMARPADFQPDKAPEPLGEEMTDEQVAEYEKKLEEWNDKVDAWEMGHRKEIPIILERRDPRFTYWKRNSLTNELMIVVEHFQITVLEAKDVYGGFLRARTILQGREDDELIWISDIWYGRWRLLLIDDMPIFPSQMGTEYDGIALHGYAKVPYAIAPFREIPHEEMNKRYRGMLTNAAGLYPMESQVLTMHVWMLAWNSWRTYKGHIADGRKLRIIPGEFVEVNPLKGESVDLMQGSPVPEELLNTAHLFDSYIQRNGVAQGPRSSEGTRSAAQLWAIQAQRQLKIEAAKQSLKKWYEQVFHLAMTIVEYNLGGEQLTIPVVGKDMDGEDYGVVKISAKIIAGYDDAFDVSFGQRLDPALLEQAKVLMEMALNRWIPMEESWRMAGLTEYPQQWTNDLIRQGVQQQPWVIEAIALQAMAEELKDDPENGPGVPGGIYELMKARIAAEQQAATNPAEPAPHQAQPASNHNDAGLPSVGEGIAQATAPRTSARPGGRPGGQKSVGPARGNTAA
jgi:hypothetical protein